MDRKISYKNLILALLLTIIVFSIGVWIGNYTVSRKYDNFQIFVSDLRLQTMSMELQYNILAEDPCKATDITYLEKELSLLNDRLNYLEQLYGVKDPEIIHLKKYYSLLQIRHWMLFNKAQNECDWDIGLILYFYSNEKCPGCDTQGSVLTSFRKKYQDEIKVYAFDINIDDPAVTTLIEIYGISEAPTIVYNGEVFSGLVDMQKLEEIKLQD
jgi:thiol-disulfide isomerase/thioredoxin